MASPPWFRLYSEVLSDRKLKRVEVITGQPKVVILGTWTIILCMASDSPERGKLLISDDMPITKEEIIAETGLSCETGEAILNAFIQAGLIEQEAETMATCNWDKRQFTSDTSNERVARHRAKKRQEAEPEAAEKQEKNDDETLPETVETDCNVTVTPPYTESDTDTDTLPIGNGGKPPPVKKKSSQIPEVDKPKKMLMATFQSETSLKMPHKKADVGQWWANIAEIYHIVDEDVGRGQQLIKDTVADMRRGGLTISSPRSIVNPLRAMAAGTNGANYGHKQTHSAGRTGVDLDKEPVYDPYTGETVYPT